MKTQEIYFPNLKIYITFYIGENAQDNFDMIDMSQDDDYWFHAKNESSCHVVAVLSNTIKKKHAILHKGALLCKQNTNKLSKKQNIEIIFTKIKHITKTDKIGCVIALNTKEMVV